MHGFDQTFLYKGYILLINNHTFHLWYFMLSIELAMGHIQITRKYNFGNIHDTWTERIIFKLNYFLLCANIFQFVVDISIFWIEPQILVGVNVTKASKTIKNIQTYYPIAITVFVSLTRKQSNNCFCRHSFHMCTGIFTKICHQKIDNVLNHFQSVGFIERASFSNIQNYMISVHFNQIIFQCL